MGLKPLDPTSPWLDRSTVERVDRLRRQGDPYELGLAADWGAGPTRVQLSYNPRQQLPSTRSQLFSALGAAGFDLRALRLIADLLPHASPVLGFEDLGRGATLYLEELQRGEDHWLRGVRAAERIVGGELPVLPGAPYILAIDLERGRSRPVAWKFYWMFDPSEEELLFSTATALFGRSLPVRERAMLQGPSPASAWMLQLRFDGGAPLLKIYKTWAYSPVPTPGVEAELRAMGAPLELAPGAPATSMGIRFFPDGRCRFTAYWCFERALP